jgi:type IV secretory pathway VirB3-like protein
MVTRASVRQIDWQHCCSKLGADAVTIELDEIETAFRSRTTVFYGAQTVSPERPRVPLSS